MVFRVLVIAGRNYRINNVDFNDYGFGKGYFKFQGLLLQPVATEPLALMLCVYKESKSLSLECKVSAWTTVGERSL